MRASMLALNGSPLLVWMHPAIRQDLARLGQLDHVHRRRVAALPARSAFQRRLKLPDRHFPRGGCRRAASWRGSYSGCIRPQASQGPVEALAYRRGRLRGPAIAFGSTSFGFSAVALQDRLARFGAHGPALQRPLRARATPQHQAPGTTPRPPASGTNRWAAV